MATLKVESNYNSWICMAMPNNSYDNDVRMTVAKYVSSLSPVDNRAVMQFSIPSLSNQVIDSATLHIYVVHSSKEVTFNFAIYDINQALSGLTFNEFEEQYADKIITTAEGTITFDRSTQSYNQWEEVDFTALVMGYRGDSHYTIIVSDSDSDRDNTSAAIASYNAVGDYTAYLEIEYHDAIPDKPSIIYPYGDIIQKGDPINFQWKYQSPWDTGQKKFEIGYKMQSESDWNTVTVSSSAEQYSLNSGTLSLGVLEWRIRTYNELNNVSEYSYGTAVIQGAATPPVITGVTNDAIPTIYWSASDSEIAKLKIQILSQGNVIYDSGVLAGGMEEQYTPDMIFPIGTYTATIQVGSIFDVWSSPVSYTFSITASGPQKPQIRVKGMGNFIRIEIPNRQSEIFIYKSNDGESYYPIARTNEDTFDDYAVRSGIKYWYYAVAYSGGSTNSDKQNAIADYKGTEIYEISNPKKSVKLFLSEDDVYLYSDNEFQTEYSLINYAGREYPIKESGEHKERRTSWTAFLKNQSKKDLEELFEKNGIYCVKSEKNVFFAAITSFSARETFFLKGYSVGLQVEQIDYDERIHVNV